MHRVWQPSPRRANPHGSAGELSSTRSRLCSTGQGRLLGSPQQPLAPTEGRSQFKVSVVTVCKALPGIHFSYQETVCHSVAATSHKSFILLLDWSVSEAFPADNRDQWSAVYTQIKSFWFQKFFMDEYFGPKVLWHRCCWTLVRSEFCSPAESKLQIKSNFG